MNTPTVTPPISRSDRTALWITIAMGAVVAAVTLVTLVQRIIQIVPNKDVPVTASFGDTPATLPIGPGGADVPVVVEQATFLVSDMPAITVASLLLAAIVKAAAILGAIVCICLFCRNLIRGRAFDRANVKLISIATGVIALGWALGGWLFTTMGANGGSATISAGNATNTAPPTDLIPAAAIVSLAAIGVAFQLGERLQRDTEGLV